MTTDVRVVDGRIEGYLLMSEYAKKKYASRRAVSDWVRFGKIEGLRVGPTVWIKEDTMIPDAGKRGAKPGSKLIGKECENEVDIFAKRLAEAMAAKDYGLSDIAMLSEVEPLTISNYVNRKSVPGLRILIRLAKALDVSLDWLCGLKD